jgi:hypothetical protein
MGVFGNQPWESDLASDWYAGLFQKQSLQNTLEKHLIWMLEIILKRCERLLHY